MRRCKVTNCQFIDRATYLCTLLLNELDESGYCISYKQDKEYLNSSLHQRIHSALQSEGYVPETQKMVNIASSLHHTPSLKRLERRLGQNES